LADIIRTAGRRQDLRALRGALVVSASEPDGLTILNVIRHFPTSTVRVDLAKGLAIAREVDQVIYQTNTAIDLVESLAHQSSDPTLLNDCDSDCLSLRLTNALNPGPFPVERMALRETPLTVNLYLPRQFRGGGRVLSRPAIVISHGLGSDVTTYDYLARHLASHGFVIINVEHPGSNADQIQDLLAGQAAEVVPDNEFVARPAQISQVLDYLEERSRPNGPLQGIINFRRIGVMGQSFGGYTSLALTGAPVNFESLQNACPPQVFSLNLSLLLQCQASLLARPNQMMANLADERFRAAIAINPITSVLFGPDSMSQIQTPTMIIAGSSDTVAPALPEQIIPFTWMNNPERYLLLMRQGTHFSTIGPSNMGGDIALPPEVIGPNPVLAQTYLKIVSLAFFKVYLENDLTYQPLLTSHAIAQLSQGEIPLSLIRSLTLEQLAENVPDLPTISFTTPTPGAF
jgi:predicted dienelactone hydrolase